MRDGKRERSGVEWGSVDKCLVSEAAEHFSVGCAAMDTVASASLGSDSKG